jgi:drug/metabolite transporter (DMT)-like permease
MKLHDAAATAMIAIAIIYLLALCILVPFTVHWRRNRRSPLEMQWAVFLGCIIFLTIIVAAFECGLMQYL